MMPDREKVIEALVKARTAGENYKLQSAEMSFQFIEMLIKLLKEQDERYKNMVLLWLREIAINNVDCNRDMTFLDAVEDIRDRASYGLKQYFIDKQEGR